MAETAGAGTIAAAIQQHDANGTEELISGSVPPPQGVGEPDPAWVRGECPVCGGKLVSNMYYRGGRGYVTIWQCWHSLGPEPICNYEGRVI